MEPVTSMYTVFIDKLFTPVLNAWYSPTFLRWYERIVDVLPVNSAFWISDYGKFLVLVGMPTILVLFSWCLAGDRHTSPNPPFKVTSSYKYSTPPAFDPTPKPSPPPAYDLPSPGPTSSGCGFFDSFSEPSYRAFLSSLPDSALLKKEKSKMLATVSSGAGVTGSAVSALASGGLTSPMILVSGRQAYLANKKLPLIREEMNRRGLRARDLTTGMVVRAVAPRAIASSIGLASHH